jgi:hypothetical protein
MSRRSPAVIVTSEAARAGSVSATFGHLPCMIEGASEAPFQRLEHAIYSEG